MSHKIQTRLNLLFELDVKNQLNLSRQSHIPCGYDALQKLRIPDPGDLITLDSLQHKHISPLIYKPLYIHSYKGSITSIFLPD